jgi:hypothetical protein
MKKVEYPACIYKIDVTVRCQKYYEIKEYILYKIKINVTIMKKNYVPTSLDQYLNENKSITLTRQYGNKPAEVVGSRAPLRNQVLAYVMENVKVTRTELKKFIAGLNETSKNPNAAANMWFKRNEKFFISESKGGVTSYKLSKLGEKLVNTLAPKQQVAPLSESDENEELDEVTKGAKQSYAKGLTDKKVNKKYGIKDKGDDKVDEEECGDDCECHDKVEEECNESREERINKLVEQIRAKRAKTLVLNEEDEEEEKEEEKEDTDVDNLPPVDDEETGEEEAEEEVDNAEAEVEDAEDDVETEDVVEDDRVEVTEFIITVDDIASALEELGELGIEASEVGMESDPEGGEEDLGLEGGEEDLGLEGGDDLDLGGDEEVAGEEDLDFDLDLGGDIEGEEEEAPAEVEESVTGMEKQEKEMWPNLTEDDEDAADELSMGDIEEIPAEEEVADPEAEVAGEEEVLDLGDEETEVVDSEEEEVTGEEDLGAEGESQIRVAAEDWDKLQGWLEAKGVDIEEMFGGSIEMEGEEAGIEDEINFDDLEDVELADEKEDVVDSEEDVEDEKEDVEDKEEDIDDEKEDADDAVDEGKDVPKPARGKNF